MLHKALFPGKYIQGAGAITYLPDLIRLFGQRGLILASPSASKRILPASGIDLAACSCQVEPFGGECCETELTRLAAVMQAQHTDVLVGMGGGKTIDTAKIAADRAGIPVIIVPTIASTDAPCSGCAVLYTDDGVFDSVYYQRANPAAVLVDTAIIAQAPVRLLVAGMGDGLATWFEARSCHTTQSPNACGGLSTLTGLHLARLCYDTLLRYGTAAKTAAEQQLVTPALEHVIEANTLLSGIGFESGGLAGAHSIHNGLTALPETHAFYHGEKVAFGLLTGLHLVDASPDEINEVYQFCEAVGLPTTLTAIGLAGCGRERLLQVAQKACAPEECIHHEAGIVTPDKVLYALLAADAVGRQRKGSFSGETIGGATGGVGA